MALEQPKIDMNYFKSYKFDLVKLKNSGEYQEYIDIKDFPETMEDEKTFFSTQLIVRENIMDSLACIIKELILYGKKMELHLESLKFKVTEQHEEVINLKEKFEKGNNVRKRFKTEKGPVEIFDKGIQTDNSINNSDTWESYQYYYRNNNSNNTREDEDPDIIEIENKIRDTSVSDDSSETQKDNQEHSSTEFTHINSMSKENEQKISQSEESGLSEENDIPDKWDPSNIKEEVENLSKNVTNELGYVYVEEYGMYYDYSSGYYYDNNSSLYYDSNTGIYFFYNPETSSYEFHSQVQTDVQNSPDSATSTTASSTAVSTNESLSKNSLEYGNTAEKDGIHCNVSSVNTSEEKSNDLDVAENCDYDVAPSLRIMVTNGSDKGRLHVVTIVGAHVGRDEKNEVILDHSSVSNVHCEISYDSAGSGDHHYYIKDLGSTNGTWVKGRRLSTSKKISEAIEIGHGWELKIGDLTMICHMHSGLLTCNECEPGLVDGLNASKHTSSECSKLKLETERRRQNKLLKKKYSLSGQGKAPQSNPSYKDRAEVRRVEVGSDNPFEKVQVASVDSFLDKDNKGFQMLQKMGWSEGKSLGVGAENAILEPVPLVSCVGRAGLGSSAPVDPTCASKYQSVHQKRLSKTQERYKKASFIDSTKKINIDWDEPEESNEKSNAKFKPIKFTSASHLDKGS